MKAKKTFSFRAIVVAAFLFIASAMSAQNLVKNGDLEAGILLCPIQNGQMVNGPFFLGDNTAYDWDGVNILNPSTSNSSGKILKNNAPCGPAQFKNNLSAYSGDRAANIVLEYSGNNQFSGCEAIGEFTSSLSQGCHWICMAITPHTDEGTVDGEVQVVLHASDASVSDKVVANFPLPTTLGWVQQKAFFSVSLTEDGHYNEFYIRLNRNHLKDVAYSGHTVNSLLFDAVAISRCNGTGDIYIVPDFVYNYTPASGGIPPVIDGTADEDGDVVIHRWDLSTGSTSDPNGTWTILEENSFTTTTATYNSGNLTVITDAYYKLEHTAISPCGERVCKAAVLYISPEGDATEVGTSTGNCSFVPVGDEFGVPAQEMQAPKAFGDVQGSKEVQTFEIWPNPPVSEITIAPVDKTTSELMKTAKCEVFDSKGAVVIPMTDISVDNTVNIEKLPVGIYYIRIMNKDNVEVQKFMKK